MRAGQGVCVLLLAIRSRDSLLASSTSISDRVDRAGAVHLTADWEPSPVWEKVGREENGPMARPGVSAIGKYLDQERIVFAITVGAELS